MAGGSSTRFLSEAHGRVGRWLRNKWHLDSLIAIGGMAAVYCSTHRNGARAAIKLLHSQYTRNDQARRRFLAEGYAANKVGHRNAVLVLDDDTTEDGEVYLVMELLEGESLEGRLERMGVMGPMEVLAIADQLLEVLASAHPKGILHRDIKPANIYLTRDGSVKLLDFGLARVRELSAEALDQSDGIVFGTVSYIAPEQARADNQNLDARSDMWSIAATMFRALSGETVHPSTGPIIERLLAVSRKPARSLASLMPQLPRPVIELVDRALAFDPEDRWPSANVMRVVVQDVMAQLQEEAESEHHDVEIQQPAPSRRTNTLPVTTKAKTLDLPSVRPGLGAGAMESGTRPKTDPIGLSTRPRNLPPSTPAPPDGDETELDLDGLYDKAEAASQSQSQSQSQSPARSRTLLTKEGRAELRRILDARRAGTSTTPDAEPVEEPRPARRLAGPTTSGVGDIAVEIEDSIIEVTIDHTHAKRSGPIAVRISEPVPAEPSQSPSPSPSPSPLEVATKPEDSASALAGVSVSGATAAAPLASESAISISVEEDEDEEVEEAEEDASDAPPPATSKPPSNLRPPSMPPQQPVPSDRRASPLATRTAPPQSQPLVDSQRGMVRPPQSPAAADSRPFAAASAREITKVGPAPVGPLALPAREGSQPTPRANSGLLHDTMRVSPVTPQARGLKDDPRPAAGPTGTMLNATIRPGAAPPPAQARPRADEPARSTVFTAPVRPGSASEPARPPSETSTTLRSSSFMPPTGRPITRAPTAVDDPARAPVVSSGAGSAASNAPVVPTASKLPTAGPRPVPTAATGVDASAASTRGIVASPVAATSGASKSAANPVATTSPAANPMVPAVAAASTGASKAAVNPVAASGAAASGASKAAASPVAASGAAASKAVATPVAASSAAASKVTASPAASAGPVVAASQGAASLIAATPSRVAAAGGTASKDPAISGAPGAAATSPVAAKPAASTGTIVSAPIVPSTAPTIITPAPMIPRTADARMPMPAPVVAPVITPVITPVVAPTVAPTVPAPSKAAPVAAAPPEAAPDRPAAPTPAPEPTPAPVRAGKSMFNPYPSLAGSASTAKTASYAAVGAADSKDSPVVSPNPRSSPNAKTAPHAAAESTVSKDSSAAPGPQDSSSKLRINSPGSKTAAYPTVGSEDPKPSDSTRSPVKTGAAPVLPFSFLRPAAKTGEAAGPTTPDDPKHPGRKKP